MKETINVKIEDKNKKNDNSCKKYKSTMNEMITCLTNLNNCINLFSLQNIIEQIERLTHYIGNLSTVVSNSKINLFEYSTCLDEVKKKFGEAKQSAYDFDDVIGVIGKDGNLENLSSIVSILSGGAQIGSIGMGDYGSAVGLYLSSTATLITTIMNGYENIKNMPTQSKQLLESMKLMETQKREMLKLGFSELECNANLVTGLEKIIDENGMVIEGYENRASVILENLNDALGTEYQIVENQIVQNGEAITSYEGIRQSVNDLVEEKKIQFSFQVFESDYIETLKTQEEIQNEINACTTRATTHMEWYENALKGVGETGGYSLKELEKCLKDDQNQLENLNGALESNNTNLEEYSDIFAAYSSGNTEEIEKTLQKYGRTLEGSMTDSSNELETFKEKIKETDKELSEKLEKKRVGSFSLDTVVNGPLKNIKGIAGVIGSWFGFKEMGGIYTNGSWTSIPQYANGGLPSHGSMFIAGERGAEIVGHINGRTEVLNRSQIASAIYSAVATAMSNYGSNSQDIRVYAEEGLIVEKVSKGINQYVKQTGSLPFNIPI